MIKIYYGLSGTLKSTTINCTAGVETNVIRSAIKNWKYNRDLLFPWLSDETNLNYALLHLTRLQEEVHDGCDFIIERGVTDPLYYEYQKQPNLITPEVIKKTVERENEILGNRDIQRILMIMEDREFISDKVLVEKTRRSCFSDVDDYLKRQKDYIEFTKTYNNLFTEKIRIIDAREYLGTLGIENV